MPTCLALDATGRRVAVPLRTVGGVEAVVTMARIVLESIRGDWAEDSGLGLPWPRWWSSPAVPLVQIEGEVRRQLADVPDLVEVRRVEAARVDGDLRIDVTITAREPAGVATARLSTAEVEAWPGTWWTTIAGTRIAGVVP